MKIDRSKLKKSSSEVPSDCKALIDRLVLTPKEGFFNELRQIETWTYGKCELMHWVDVLDICDDVLSSATVFKGWTLACDECFKLKECVLWTLHFTTLLIEHSFSRHLYSSMEHLTSLLSSSDLDIILAVLNLLYMFSKRSNFITRLAAEKRSGLLSRLSHLAVSWGGKDNGFGLSQCCTDVEISQFPDSATTLHFEFSTADPKTGKKIMNVIHVENVDRLEKSPPAIMEELLESYEVPKDKQMLLFTYLRLAHSFSNFNKRLKCVQSRLQALSILIYSNQITDNIQSLLYSGLLEELVEVLEMKGDYLMEIKAVALKSLTSIIHLDRNPSFPKLNTIIDVTGASCYHGFLPILVRNCISSLTVKEVPCNPFPQNLATALFSFLYHLASYEAGGEALVSCGMMESLLKVVQWPSAELDHITFVTRAVRVIDLITNLDMQSFESYSGLTIFIARLELEVEHCRAQQPFEIQVFPDFKDSTSDNEMETSASVPDQVTENTTNFKDCKVKVTCLPQRAALIKSMLNFLKKAIQDPALSDSVRHIMDGSLPSSLKHMISNAEYYGPSLFLLATDVVTNYVFQEPSLLSPLQETGLTHVVLHALLIKDVPSTREVLGSLPNVFSALCLNTRGLNAFVECKPFDRLFKVLLSPDYLPAMRRRRSSEPTGDTALNLGSAMDELMRHQPSLKESATKAIIKLLDEICVLGRDPKYICWKATQKLEMSNQSTGSLPQNTATSVEATGSSDEEEDEEEEGGGSTSQAIRASSETPLLQPSEAKSSLEKEPVPLVAYIHNVMKFVDAILSNNSTDDHCREFVLQQGLTPLMGIMGLPNLPIDFPAQQACQSVAGVCKAILNLAHEPLVLQEGLSHLNEVLKNLEPLHVPLKAPGGSVLLRELVSSPNIAEAISNPQYTPLLHFMSSAHAYIQMFIHMGRTGQSDIRTIYVSHWGSELGISVLNGLSRLYTSLVWESTILLALCSEDTLPAGCEFGKADMDKLIPYGDSEDTSSPGSGTESNSSVTVAMENLSTDPIILTMDVDNPIRIPVSPTVIEKKDNTKFNPILHNQIKQIKSLLSASSRLGRALAELFAILVKLCVGSPTRQRRGPHVPSVPAPPSSSAHAVASALANLLASGLSWLPPPTSPIPRFRLTFFICSVGFTAPMLFDEKKSPYHLMLKNFQSSGAQKAFFDTFYWALSIGGKVQPEEGLESDELPDGTGEFLDSWLMLLEKMSNPKSIMESPHTVTVKSTEKHLHFDPMEYLIQTHTLAFHAVMKIWGKKPLKVYGPRMTESALSILCHILKGEKLQAEKKQTKSSNLPNVEASSDSIPSDGNLESSGPVSLTLNESSSSGAVPPDTCSSQELQILMDMGFPRQLCVLAMSSQRSLSQATEYLLSLTSPHYTTLESERRGVEFEDLKKAIAMSLGATSFSEVSTDLNKKLLNKHIIDEFTEHVLSGCLTLLDALPDAVFRACDLLMAVFNRNGSEFKEKTLNVLIEEVKFSINSLLIELTSITGDNPINESFFTSSVANRAAARIHFFILIFEDCKLLCAKIVSKSKILHQMTNLLSVAKKMLNKSITPKWMTPLLLFIDLHEKVLLGMQRKATLASICSHTWKWYDLVNGKWLMYVNTINNTIDEAFWSGETSVRFTMGQRKYTIQFGSMMQANDETGNRRPIMLCLKTDDTEHPDPQINFEMSESMSSGEKDALLESCVGFLSIPVDSDALNAVLRLCLRLTQNFDRAVKFASLSGIKLLLELKQSSAFSGYSSLVTLLVRHILESPSTLRYTMEQVIRSATLTSQTLPTKELHYLLRALAPAACRAPNIFLSVAKELLSVDFSLGKRGDISEDSRLMVKSIPTKSTLPPLEKISQSVIIDLLNFLVKWSPDEETHEDQNTTPNVLPSSSHSEVQSTSSGDLLGVCPPLQARAFETAAATDNPSTSSSSTEVCKNINKPLLSKASVCRLLAELVKSYAGCAELITEHIFEIGTSEIIKEETSALAFLLDELLISKSDKDIGQLIKTLIASISACNNSSNAQTSLVCEIKYALGRSLCVPEAPIKHVKIQALMGLISTIIESSSNATNTLKQGNIQANMNNMVKIMYKKGLVTDLARISHSLDLSSPNIAFTMNSVLKPLEILTRIINQPSPLVSANKNKTSKYEESSNRTSSSEMENCTAGNLPSTTASENEELTESDLDTRVHEVPPGNNPNSENQLQAVEESNDDDFDEIMDQLLERTSRDEPIVDDSVNTHTFTNTEQEHHTAMQNEGDDTVYSSHQCQDEDRTSDSSHSAIEDDHELQGMDIENEDEDDEDEEEEDDDEGGSPYDDDDNEEDTQAIEDAIYHLPPSSSENSNQRLDIMMNSDQENTIHSHVTIRDRQRLHHLPLWSDINSLASGNADSGTNQTSHVTPSHPLLMGRQPIENSNLSRGASGGASVNPATATVRSLLRNRGPRPVLQLNSRSQNSPSTPAILQNFLGNSHQDLITLNLRRNGAPIMMDIVGVSLLDSLETELTDFEGNSNGRSALPSIPSALVRWSEESRVIDGDSMHDAVTILKPELVEGLEKIRSEEIKKKSAELPEPDKKSDSAKSIIKSQSPVLTSTPCSISVASTSTALPDRSVTTPVNVNFPSCSALSSTTASDAPVTSLNSLVSVFYTGSSRSNTTTTDSSNQPSLPVALAPLSPSPEDSINLTASASTAPVVNEEVPGPSGVRAQENSEDYTAILGDVEIPEGVDPSFLAALPEEMRQEVIEDQRRLQSIRHRVQQQNIDTITEVNPEFLAALPPNIQEEVLAQQRIENQRQASESNPEAPVDPREFLQTLPPSLRQSVLEDMEDSQMAALPSELAAEAQSLRSEYEQRNRSLVHERFFSSGGASNSIGSLFRPSVTRYGSQLIIGNLMGREGFRLSSTRFSDVTRDRRHQAFLSSSVRFRGRQLLDNEGLSCLLVLLFIDDPKMNTSRLHRILRNLCYHSATREWVIHSLLSILERANTNVSKSQFSKKEGSTKSPSNCWLNISLDAALGFRANVFQIHKSAGKKVSEKLSGSITIHPLASSLVCRHTLEVLISLAKNFSSYFIPSSSNIVKLKSSDIWDTLLRLDFVSTSRKGKLVLNPSIRTFQESNESNVSGSFESSPFGVLLTMLNCSVIQKNSLLTDRLLRLLSIISLGKSDSKTESIPISKAHLNLAVDVLTSKSCSEDGLEDVTALLINLSHGPPPTRDAILCLLLKAAQKLGNVVRQSVIELKNELMAVKKDKDSQEVSAGTSKEKGGIIDRFTKETVVIASSKTKNKSNSELQLPSMYSLTTKTSSQTFFLRVLKVIIQLREAALCAMKKDVKKEDTNMEVDTHDTKLESLSEQLCLEEFWETLSDCLKDLAETQDSHAVLVLQSSVESFFLVHAAPTHPDEKKRTHQKETRQEQLAHIQEQLSDSKIESSISPEQSSHVSTDTKKFLTFAETHRVVLNQILRQSPGHLADGTFSVLVDHTRVLDFDIKRKYFRTELERMDESIQKGDLAVHVRRENVFEESFRELHRRSPEEWKSRFYIVFEGEEGQDAGGLLREWYVIISREIFNPMYALFKTSPGDKVTYMIYESSQTNHNHLDYFKFVGRVIAKAIYDNKLLECYFTRSFYKHILGKPVRYTDMESEDYAFYKGLEFLTNNKVADLGYDLTFSTEIQEFGVTEVRDLIPNGRNITVTEETKLDYIRLVCQMKMTGAIRKQLSAFLEGFYNIIPRRLISIFNEQELELLLSGLPSIDIEDLKSNTEYNKYQSNSLQIVWFWRALRSFDQTDKAKFMQFVTGSSKVPLQGFAHLEGMNGVQKFQIHKDDRSTDRLPSAHTCFNQLDLPAYETYDKLRTYLQKAIHECSEGFGFA